MLQSQETEPAWMSTDGWITEMWYIYTKEFYLAMKENEIMTLAGKCGEPETMLYSCGGAPLTWGKSQSLQNHSIF